MTIHAPSCDAMGDDALVVQAASGEADAFEELYRRHHVRAQRLARRITRNDDDAREAAAEAFMRVFDVLRSRGLRQGSSFRAYLMTTVRHLGIDKVRQRSRMASSDDAALLDGMSPVRGPADTAVSSEDGRLLLHAFRQLPPRAQSVLWLVDVERVPTRVAAQALGLTPGNVAQIAVRARTRLRHSYVQAHLAGAIDRGCRFTVEHMSSFLDGDLCQASVTKLEAHLSECAPCRGRVEELRDLGVSTRRALLPALLLERLTRLFRRGRKRAAPQAVVPSADVAATIPAQALPLGTQVVSVVSNPAAVDVLQTLGQSPVVQRVVAYVAAGTMALGASSVALKSTPTGPPAADATVSVAAGPAVPGAVKNPPDGPAGPNGPGPGPSAPALAGGAGVVGSLQPGGVAALSGAGLVNAATGTASPVPSAVAPVSGVLAGVLSGPPPPAAGGGGQAPAGPILTVPPLPLPPVGVGPGSAPPASPAPPAQGIPSPSIPAAPVTVPPVSVPASVPSSVPALGAPLPVAPLAVPTTVALSTPPLTVPPATVPLVPLATPQLAVAPLSVPVSASPSTPPLSVPSVPVPVSVPAAAVPLPVPASTPPLAVPPVSVPVSAPPLTVPVVGAPVSVPVSAPPVAAPLLGPLPPTPLSTVTSGILP